MAAGDHCHDGETDEKAVGRATEHGRGVQQEGGGPRNEDEVCHLFLNVDFSKSLIDWPRRTVQLGCMRFQRSFMTQWVSGSSYSAVMRNRTVHWMYQPPTSIENSAMENTTLICKARDSRNME